MLELETGPTSLPWAKYGVTVVFYGWLIFWLSHSGQSINPGTILGSIARDRAKNTTLKKTNGISR